MSYIDNLAGVFKTKLDAQNDMDRFRRLSALTKGERPAATTGRSSAGRSEIGGLLLAGGLALVAAIATSFLKGTPKATGSNGDAT